MLKCGLLELLHVCRHGITDLYVHMLWQLEDLRKTWGLIVEAMLNNEHSSLCWNYLFLNKVTRCKDSLRMYIQIEVVVWDRLTNRTYDRKEENMQPHKHKDI